MREIFEEPIKLLGFKGEFNGIATSSMDGLVHCQSKCGEISIAVNRPTFDRKAESGKPEIYYS